MELIQQDGCLLDAVSDNDILEVRKYLARGDDPNQEDKGSTPLIVASSNGDIEIVQLLLTNGANINKTNRLGYSAIHWATRTNKLEMVKFLLSEGASLDKGPDPLSLAQSQAMRDILVQHKNRPLIERLSKWIHKVLGVHPVLLLLPVIVFTVIKLHPFVAFLFIKRVHH